MPKQFYEVHGLLTLDAEREVWHPVISVTNEELRDRHYQRLISDDDFCRKNGTILYEDFKKVDPPPTTDPSEQPRRRKVEYIRADEPKAEASVPGEQGTAEPPRRRRRSQKARDRAEPRAQRSGRSGGRSGTAEPETEPRPRSRRRKNRSS